MTHIYFETHTQLRILIDVLIYKLDKYIALDIYISNKNSIGILGTVGILPIRTLGILSR